MIVAPPTCRVECTRVVGPVLSWTGTARGDGSAETRRLSEECNELASKSGPRRSGPEPAGMVAGRRRRVSTTCWDTPARLCCEQRASGETVRGCAALRGLRDVEGSDSDETHLHRIVWAMPVQSICEGTRERLIAAGRARLGGRA
ncbi:hypothetical protein C8T65DRAFT_652998 [Cerioporus squamosus]|nr:hypothetical protein C8T65DRAFT_652998 [Cerioporus squamosus]